MMLDLAKNFERLVKDPKVSRKNSLFSLLISKLVSLLRTRWKWIGRENHLGKSRTIVSIHIDPACSGREDQNREFETTTSSRHCPTDCLFIDEHRSLAWTTEMERTSARDSYNHGQSRYWRVHRWAHESLASILRSTVVQSTRSPICHRIESIEWEYARYSHWTDLQVENHPSTPINDSIFYSR